MPGMLGGKENRLFPPFAFAGGSAQPGFPPPGPGHGTYGPRSRLMDPPNDLKAYLNR